MSNIILPSVSNQIVDESGKVYRSLRELSKHINKSRTWITHKFSKSNSFTYGGHTYCLTGINGSKNPKKTIVNTSDGDAAPKTIIIEREREDEDEYRQFKIAKDVQALPFESYDINLVTRESGMRYAIALFSDAHIEQVVKPETVCGMNEYNIEIAKKRIQRYFVGLVACLKTDDVDELIFASLGDTISGYIHEELQQTNELTPLEATLYAQSLIYSGLKYIVENTNLEKITFIGITGNHSRTSKKIQHSNNAHMSYEWLMYMNIKKQCELTGLDIDFIIPDSEIVKVDMSDGKRFLFQHGFQVKSGGNGTVCGIYPSLNRYTMRCDKNFKQDKVYMGHYHSCTSIPNAVVNGSIIGMDAFAFSMGCAYERPAQMYEVYDTNIGLLVTRQIYCD